MGAWLAAPGATGATMTEGRAFAAVAVCEADSDCAINRVADKKSIHASHTAIFIFMICSLSLEFRNGWADSRTRSNTRQNTEVAAANVRFRHRLFP
jgi:hypothetical protein